MYFYNFTVCQTVLLRSVTGFPVFILSRYPDHCYFSCSRRCTVRIRITILVFDSMNQLMRNQTGQKAPH